MWNFYDELYMGIPSGIRVEGCVIGKLWTTVRANGNIGVARTLGAADDTDLSALAQSVIGMHLRDVANVLKWNSLLRASVGVAAMNAFYNRPDRVKELSAPPAFRNELGGKQVVVIGDLPNLEAGLKDGCDLTVLPLPEDKDLGAGYAEAMKADFVFVSGDALINRTLPALLAQVGENTKVSLSGVSVPAAPVLFAFGNPIHNLSGVFTVIPTTVECAAKLDQPDLAPGTQAFSVNPVKPRYLHEQTATTRFAASPYKAAAFNSAFNPWEGKEYDQSIWSPIFKG